jgi:hypothetical protein
MNVIRAKPMTEPVSDPIADALAHLRGDFVEGPRVVGRRVAPAALASRF